MKKIPIGRNADGRDIFLTPEMRGTSHMHVVGGTRTGKSKFLEWMMRKILDSYPALRETRSREEKDRRKKRHGTAHGHTSQILEENTQKNLKKFRHRLERPTLSLLRQSWPPGLQELAYKRACVHRFNFTCLICVG